MSNDDAFSSPELSVLADAVARGDAAEIRRQLERIDADTPGSDGSTLLMAAIKRGSRAGVEALLEGGADPNRADPRGDTPVHAAAFSGDADLLRAVLARGGDANARNPHTGATPLVQALLSPEATQYAVLLEAGADPDIADHNGDTPLHVAARTNNGGAILALLERGASPLAKNAGGATFQSYYFGYNRAILNDRALGERKAVVEWLKAHGVPLEAAVSQADQQ
ncbi:ankyrin repeat domain-containing protein [Luteimonas saliphila]|uniref:ankyrin repeat domain-containing protein n=1 Tax=Luteimonas saliphila TaxID=2804919 RepID=UPI00192D280D|nr:ankyrin repeat domain-containing protein [Luteimonas saliphila]